MTRLSAGVPPPARPLKTALAGLLEPQEKISATLNIFLSQISLSGEELGVVSGKGSTTTKRKTTNKCYTNVPPLPNYQYYQLLWLLSQYLYKTQIIWTYSAQAYCVSATLRKNQFKFGPKDASAFKKEKKANILLFPALHVCTKTNIC